MVALSHPQPSTEHPLVAAMRTVEAAQLAADDADKMLLRCSPSEMERAFPGSTYEQIGWARDLAVAELVSSLRMSGLDVGLLARALEGEG